MRVSTEWLSDYISLEGVAPQDLAERITRAGIEIDIVENRNQGVTKVVVGYVISKEKHPDADKLNICKVDAGLGEELQIVCGAKNVDAGQKVPVALVGAKLPGGLEIKKAKLRGALSQGMICSAKELGLNDKLLPKELQEGILVLPAELEVGTPIEQVLGLNDHVLELDLTPNRSDALSMIGAAYEVSAILSRDITLPAPEADLKESGSAAADHISVQVDAPELCTHYSARYISGVSIKPSPLWMQNRLMAAGIRPINNIVDITNYVMLEYGQPLHAFDADQLSGGSIVVRRATEGETMITLDDQERKLKDTMLLITDGAKPVAIAGVMGGQNSEVTSDTANILLESAKFDGTTVRKTSRELGLRSESSLRFEKNVDPGSVIPALNRAASLISAYAGGNVHPGIVESTAGSNEERVIALSVTKVNNYLGTSLSAEEIHAIFDRLHFTYETAQENELLVTVPTRRGDITRDVDLIEEVARLYGYDHIPTTVIEGPTTAGSLTKPQLIRRALRGLLSNAGYQEMISYSFVNPERSTLFSALTAGSQSVKLAMPMSEELSVLRTSALPQMLEAAQYNRNRKQESLALFEIGSVFYTEEETLTKQPKEIPVLSLLLSGNRIEKQWNITAEKVDFFDLKGAVESIFAYLGLEGQISYAANQPKDYHPGRSASIYLKISGEEQVLVGTLGQVHPELQLAYDLGDTYIAELSLEALYDEALPPLVYRELPRFPAVSRDIAVVVEQSVEAGVLMSSIRESAGELLQSVQVFDIYTGEKVGEGKKSIALALTYRHKDHTLTEEEITAVHTKVLTDLSDKTGAELRK
ncbi:phenylalanine--tRNA ligase subunit beta [Paenibacillus urinalis]|uniref:Phenylalanine--tRNA ligase beta subunit n=1 Tax=Paenibacillus urinalis TaxID=521520 RepID=A0AAX3N3C1_9BACL|nr:MULTISPECIES: phenylalanine--tRNA ligase subunit beta [Paenibacillus]WDH84163.1 phenylalanine--tRNA ligase subunit beta [Paenibacillus urinalis]WDH95606.1 phenylalanine--tRNA ligase subunit beta [Paenibacillus urinalis]WDI03803.1 phenylalanine--tRNA ligase subunit beta [Paenibacillus urinalis]GAK38856.1 phenylalanyl-tRNA synthetase subunit beta [Paenibacillus sp. TCA20]